VCDHVCGVIMRLERWDHVSLGGMLKIIVLFCRILSLLKGSFAKEENVRDHVCGVIMCVL